MADIDPDKKLRAPLLERLLGKAGKDLVGSESRGYQFVHELRESIRNDLQNLFNSRQRVISTPRSLKLVDKSLLNYGLPDLSGYNFASSSSRKTLCDDIENIILNYEPRIQKVTVTSEGGFDPEDANIYFKVEVVVHADPAPAVLVFNSAVNPITQFIDVAESSS